MRAFRMHEPIDKRQPRHFPSIELRASHQRSGASIYALICAAELGGASPPRPLSVPETHLSTSRGAVQPREARAGC
jgi:hypothetical protein